MKIVFMLLGALCFGALVFVTGVWYGQPLFSRQFVLRRLNRPMFFARLSARLPKSRSSVEKRSDLTEQLSALSELLDSTARNLRLGYSMASALRAATEANDVTNQTINELVATTSHGESFTDATKRLVSTSKTSELIFAVRTLELAATGGVGGVLALERAAIVLRERSTNIHDREMQAAQAMLSTKVLSWAPVVVAGWLILTSNSVRNFLILSLSGWLCTTIGIGFNYAGRRWMQTIVSPATT